MVEIRYGEYYDVADLAGKSVAEVREQYKEEFGIPDKAQAQLSGKGIRKKLEPKIELNDEDELSFAEKSRKGLFFIGAILLAMAVTGGIFGYGALTDTVSATVDIEAADFVDVVGANPPSWTTWGGYTGSIPATDEVFSITPANDFTGDFVLQIYFTNVEDLAEVYRVLGMRFTVTNHTGNAAITGVTPTPTTGFLSLTHPTTEIEVVTTGTPNGNDIVDVDLLGGFYRTHFYTGPWGTDNEDPDIFCKVIQKGS